MTARGETKKKILKIALELFSRNGYDGTSIRNISKKVGIRESAVYNHFPAKEKIFSEIIRQFKSQDIAAKIVDDDLIEKITDPLSFLNEFSERLIKLWNTEEERKYLRLILMEHFRKVDGEEITLLDQLNKLRSVCQLIFEQMINYGLVKKDDPKLLADEFISTLYFIRIQFLVKEGLKNLSEVFKLTQHHVLFFWNAIKM